MLKKFLSITLLATMLVTNFSQALVYADEPTEKKEESLDAEIEELIAQRQEARKNKDFAKADEIRDKLQAMGIVLKDTREGVKWERE